jgi:hypothetical protein
MSRLRGARLPIVAVLLFLVVGGSAASADCGGEVEAAFRKLETGRPYRSETTIAISDEAAERLGPLVPVPRDRKFRETTESIPPDRMRKTLDYGSILTEVIKVGERTWIRLGQGQEWVQGGSWATRETYPGGAAPPGATFTCLGTVAFEDKTYDGYRTILPRLVVSVEIPGQSKKKEEERSEKLVRREPPLWRTILVDRQTRLPAYQIDALTDQLDRAAWRMRYTFPGDITIEPPVQ